MQSAQVVQPGASLQLLGVREGKGPIGWFLDIAESEFPDTAAKA